MVQLSVVALSAVNSLEVNLLVAHSEEAQLEVSQVLSLLEAHN
jgi:hypothetical protein